MGGGGAHLLSLSLSAHTAPFLFLTMAAFRKAISGSTWPAMTRARRELERERVGRERRRNESE